MSWPHRLRIPLALGAALIASMTVPRHAVGNDAEALFDGELRSAEARADHLAAAVERGVAASDFHTGGSRFDGEWALATHTMAILALAQLTREHPALGERYLPAMRVASAALLAPESRSFATDAWHGDALDALDDPSPRDAWLGYAALGLSMHRTVDPHFAHGVIHDAILRSLRARIERASDRLIATYPGETYPVDVSASIAAIAVWDRHRGADPTAFVAAFEDALRAGPLDPASHLLAQHRGGAPRGSGTALAAYFLGLAGSPLSRELFASGLRPAERTLLGFSAIAEHPDGSSSGDIDSGPVLFGVSVSATGFTLAGARQHRDRDLFVRLHRTAALFGVPYRSDAGEGFVTGGPLGEAILLAMETAAPVEVR